MKRKINALSFTPKYDELEDRIRISINYDNLENRVDFMMSRSFVLKMFPVLDDYMIKFYELELSSPRMPQENTKQNITQDKATSLTDNTNLELYKQDDELLIEIQFSYVQKTQLSIVKFISKNSEAVTQLDKSSLQQIFTIIKSTVPFFSWGISQNL